MAVGTPLRGGGWQELRSPRAPPLSPLREREYIRWVAESASQSPVSSRSQNPREEEEDPGPQAADVLLRAGAQCGASGGGVRTLRFPQPDALVRARSGRASGQGPTGPVVGQPPLGLASRRAGVGRVVGTIARRLYLPRLWVEGAITPLC